MAFCWKYRKKIEKVYDRFQIKKLNILPIVFRWRENIAESKIAAGRMRSATRMKGGWQYRHLSKKLVKNQAEAQRKRVRFGEEEQRNEWKMTFWKKVVANDIQSATTMERDTGIEPACSAWEADILPLNYTCKCFSIITEPIGNCKGISCCYLSFARDNMGTNSWFVPMHL